MNEDDEEEGRRRGRGRRRQRGLMRQLNGPIVECVFFPMHREYVLKGTPTFKVWEKDELPQHIDGELKETRNCYVPDEMEMRKLYVGPERQRYDKG